MAQVTAKKKRGVNIESGVKMEHCFGDEETREIPEGEKHQGGFSTPLRMEEGIIYLKQQLLKDTFAVKRCGTGQLVQIKEEEVYKIITNKEFTKEEDSPFEEL